jgi:hypothetical protein
MARNLQLPETSKRLIQDTNNCLIIGKEKKQVNQETNILKRQTEHLQRSRKKQPVLLRSAQFFF